MSEQTTGQLEHNGYEFIRHHWDEVLATVRHIITQFADEAIEIAARAVMLAAPMPNAISVYNITQTQQQYTPFQATAFALTIEVVVFFLVEIALKMWSRFLDNPRVYRWPFYIMVGVVLCGTGIVIRMVYALEPHKDMAWLPVISLCSFIAIGLKRWDAKKQETAVQTAIVPEVRKAEQPVNDAAIERRKQVATYYKDNATASYQAAADTLNITSKATVYNDLKWLEKQGVLHVQRDGKTTNVEVNGQYEHFVNG